MPEVASIIRAWRALTASATGAGRRTLVACSGGADSTALALALRSATPDIVIAHVVHDLRPRTEALADRDAVAALARALDTPFAEARVRARRAGGNLEATARRLRYRALARLAQRHECRFIACAHHANDQAETFLMRLLRGAGPRGLGAMSGARVLKKPTAKKTTRARTPSAGAVLLIRPMLEVTRADAESICRSAGVQWQEDRTNRDTTRLRAGLRHDLMPVMERLAPGFVARIARTAGLQRQVDRLIRARAGRLLSRAQSAPHTWSRPVFARAPSLIQAAALRLAIATCTRQRGVDSIKAANLDGCVRALRARPDRTREYTLGPVIARVSAAHLQLRARAAPVRSSRVTPGRERPPRQPS